MTAYEMRIGDWSSDVCSSDLPAIAHEYVGALERAAGSRGVHGGVADQDGLRRTWSGVLGEGAAGHEQRGANEEGARASRHHGTTPARPCHAYCDRKSDV